MTSYTTETIDNTTYFSVEDARGNSTMMWELFGTVFVQTNSSPAKALQDISKRSKSVEMLCSIVGVK